MNQNKEIVFNGKDLSIFHHVFRAVLVLILVACTPEPPSVPGENVQVTKVTEGELIVGKIVQTKTFNQCDSASNFEANVQFSDSNSQTNQQQLVLGANATGGFALPNAVKLEVTGSIEQHFSETQAQGQAHYESVSIDVPPHTWQEYTITWEETRRNGAVEYVEDGQAKSISYSYRIGLQLVSAVGKDIICPGTPPPTVNVINTQAPVSPGSFAPIIDRIEIESSVVCDGRKYDVTIYFHDPNGDAYLISWELLYSKNQASFSSQPREFMIDSQAQISGAVFHDFVVWNTLGDDVKIRVTIEDKAGLSGSKDFSFTCAT